jgi:hypothetical protein
MNTARQEAKATLQLLADLKSMIPSVAKAQIWREIASDIMTRFSEEGTLSLKCFKIDYKSIAHIRF